MDGLLPAQYNGTGSCIISPELIEIDKDRFRSAGQGRILSQDIELSVLLEGD